MQVKGFIKNYEAADQGVSWLLMWFPVVVMKNGHSQGIAWSLTVPPESAVGS